MRKGFTLVELLVVVAIIAILSTIAFGVFNSSQQAGRDARRRGDIDAIANALEANKTTSSYQNVVGSQFASGSIPFDPKATGVTTGVVTGCGTTSPANLDRCWYCFKIGADASTQTYCDWADDRWVSDDLATYGLTQNWVLCANLETGNPKYYCRRSLQ